ncbi:MAG: DUF3461 family protein [Gammaproteobacteria bacterium]|nr:DUF3461 family protein [Gammaproteobacteria bacterium]
MPDYPTLSEMGILNPSEIDRYSLQTVNNIDILRVVYRRKKGSILPDSKRFRFPRTEKISLGRGDARSTQVFYEISPVVHKAMIELDKIVRAKKDKNQQMETIREEMQRLQEETSTRIDYINSLIEELG